ncbi:putative heme oxygenase [Megalodesulfovibrio gigas DSM 1382 = ATCC 19364]|uniref:Putative heme oxygenase n=1 Tax=Megalodesulfovibrio gigas (strain ATCC 19364 / DSM 1382 / NCIMB 9332 / VKM B-1759) TaxID=1121448 RepID=T2GEI0_MEGG1|nr:putative heme oxygenase [Megalodesulfovibrio gigas DSM 1382 = ATCC 19364]
MEHASPLTRVARGDASLMEYTAALRLLYGFIAPLESGIATFAASGTEATALLQALLQAGHWQRTHLLEQDLRVLGLPAEAIRQLPQCTAMPSMATPAQAVGALYLLEGSRLGGKVIATSLNHALGLDEHSGAAYFSSNGEELGAVWHRFRLVLEEVAAAGHGPAVIEAARQAFLALGVWFEHRGAA